MNFYALFKAGETTVAKTSIKGMTVNPLLEASMGVDLLAIVCMGNALAGDGSSAGVPPLTFTGVRS